MRHKGIYLTFFLMIVVEILFSFSTYSSNRNFQEMISVKNAPAWENLLSGYGVLNGLFFPILLAVLASRLCDIEHNGNTWKLLCANAEKMETIWKNKLIMLLLFLAAALGGQVLALVYYGKSLGIVAELPVKTIVQFFVASFMVSFTISIIQLLLSFVFANQLIPMAIGMLGAFIGFIATLLPPVIRNILIWGNYAELLVYTQESSDSTGRQISLAVKSINFFPIISVFLVGVILLELTNIRMKKLEL